MPKGTRSFQERSSRKLNWCHDDQVKSGQQSRKRLQRGRTPAKCDGQRARRETGSSGAWQHNAGCAATNSCRAGIKAPPPSPLFSCGGPKFVLKTHQDPQGSLTSSEQRRTYSKGLEFQLKHSPRNDSGRRAVLEHTMVC